MNKFDILKKYNLMDAADREIKIKMKNHRGAADLVTEFGIYENLLNKKWIEVRDKINELMANKVCDKFDKFSDFHNLAHDNCQFCYSHNKTICQNCEFYNKEIKALEEARDELRKAQQDFQQAAGKVYWEI